MDVGSFTFGQGLYLDLKTFQLCTSIPDFFTFFQKLCSFPFKYTVERHIAQWDETLIEPEKNRIFVTER